MSLGSGKNILQLKTKHKTFFAKERKVFLITLNVAYTTSDSSPGSIRNGGEEGRSAEISFSGSGL